MEPGNPQRKRCLGKSQRSQAGVMTVTNYSYLKIPLLSLIINFPHLGYRDLSLTKLWVHFETTKNIITKFDLFPFWSSWDSAPRFIVYFYTKVYIGAYKVKAKCHICVWPWYYPCRPPEKKFNGYQSKLLSPYGYGDLRSGLDKIENSFLQDILH